MTTPPVSARKIDIGAVLSRIFQLYGDTWQVLIPVALMLFVPVALISAIFADSVFGSFVANFLSLVASLFFAGVVVRAVQDAYEDHTVDQSVGQLFSVVAPVVFQLFLVGLVAGIAVAIGLLLLIVPGLILLTIWSVAAPVVVLEKPGVFAALGRSYRLVRGNGWQVFGVLVAIFAITIVLAIVIGAIGAIGDSIVVLFFVTLLLTVAIAPLQALVQGVLYFALREAHGEPGLSVSTGLITGEAGTAFAPPAAPPAPEGGTDAFGHPIAPEAPPAPEPAPGEGGPPRPEGGGRPGGSTPPPGYPGA